MTRLCNTPTPQRGVQVTPNNPSLLISNPGQGRDNNDPKPMEHSQALVEPRAPSSFTPFQAVSNLEEAIRAVWTSIRQTMVSKMPLANKKWSNTCTNLLSPERSRCHAKVLCSLLTALLGATDPPNHTIHYYAKKPIMPSSSKSSYQLEGKRIDPVQVSQAWKHKLLRGPLPKVHKNCALCIPDTRWSDNLFFVPKCNGKYRKSTWKDSKKPCY